MKGFLFSVTLLVTAETVADAADAVNEVLREESPELVVDWYLAPDGWKSVRIPEDYEEGDAFGPGWDKANLVGPWSVECYAANDEVLMHREFALRDEAEAWRDEMLPYFVRRVDIFRNL